MRKLAAVVATVVAACCAVPATYAALRAYDVLFRPPEQNPATVVWSAHIAMFWRLGIGLYVAGMAAPLVYRVAVRDLDRTMRALASAVVVAAVLIAAQGILMP